MQQGYVEVNGVRTKVVTWGRWIEDKPASKEEDIVLLIPGNPGITKFYFLFLQTLHEQLKCPVWVVSHAGHEPPASKAHKDFPLKKHEHLFDLQGQVDHKIAFIDKYVPEKARLHVVAHSIGAYMALKLLDVPEINAKVVHNYLLFPTIEDMAVTPNGVFIIKIIKPVLWFVLMFTWLFTLLPDGLQTFAVSIYMKLYSIPKIQTGSIRALVNADVLEKVFFLAYDEMDLVNGRDDALLKRNVAKLKFYYSSHDGWTPISYYEKLKKDIPGVDVQLNDFYHSFVLNSSRDVANIVAVWIKEKM